jgi:hypothetical protein
MIQPCLFCSGDAGEPGHYTRCDGRQGAQEAAAAVFFDGETYEAALDRDRLRRQLERVLRVMADHDWHTLHEIAAVTGGDPEASVSARLRDLRKERFGSRLVSRRRRGYELAGLFEYRLEPTTRHEIPASRTSWREGDRVVVVTIGAHCIDEAWPWWWAPRAPGAAAPRPTPVAAAG